MSEYFTLSIVTVCYNAEKFIEEAIESVLNQRGKFLIEYFVIDGHSSDSTLKKIRHYINAVEEGRYPIRCKGIRMSLVSEPDKGMYDGLAKGLSRVTGDVVAYLNADDYYLPNCFSAVATVLQSHPNVKWLTGLSTWYNERGHITHNNLPPCYKREMIVKGIYGEFVPHIQQESTFWRSHLLDCVSMDKLAALKFAGDFYLWSCFATEHNLEVLNTQLAGFRVRAGQKSDDKIAYQSEFESLRRETPRLRDRVYAHFLKMIWHFSVRWKLKWLSGYISLQAPSAIDLRLNMLD